MLKTTTFNFTFLLLHGALPLNDFLVKIKKFQNIDNKCKSCNNLKDETLVHLTLECPVAIDIWNWIEERFTLKFEQGEIKNVLNGIWQIIELQHIKLIITAIFSIWKYRCNLVLGQTENSLDSVQTIFLKEYYMDKQSIPELKFQSLWPIKKISQTFTPPSSDFPPKSMSQHQGPSQTLKSVIKLQLKDNLSIIDTNNINTKRGKIQKPNNPSSTFSFPEKRTKNLLIDTKNHQTELWIADKEYNIYLSRKEKFSLLNDHWLTDKHIHSAQIILQRQFPNIAGMQDPVLLCLLAIRTVSTPFAQILHTGSDHWILAFNFKNQPNVITICDSLYKTVQHDVVKKISMMLGIEPKALIFNILNVQKQNGTQDCGLFSIAFLTSVCYDRNPEKEYYDQKSMRSHLASCLEKRFLTIFPQRND